VKLLYFAWLKTKTGIAEEEVTPPEGVATVGELLAWLEGRGPGFADALADRRAIRVAVNQAYAQPGDPVRAGDEVAIFPPVTGG
jgi:sulfur-carrier protein